MTAPAPVDERTFRTQDARSSRDVLAFYDTYAPNWDARFGDSPSTRAFHEIRLDSFLRLARLGPEMRLVELGVGTGAYLDAIAPKVHDVVCIDGSRGMLDVLEAKHRGLANIRAEQRDLEQTLADVEFAADLVYCFGLLEHIIRVDVFVRNCARMLRPGGRFVIIAPNGRSPWYGAMRRVCRSGAHCSTDRYYTPEQCARLLAPAGFESDGVVYWGWAPAGVPMALFRTLESVGSLLAKTPLRRYAGGMTVAFKKVR